MLKRLYYLPLKVVPKIFCLIIFKKMFDYLIKKFFCTIKGYNVISPWRWLAAVLIPIVVALWGLKRKSIDLSGAILGKIL